MPHTSAAKPVAIAAIATNGVARAKRDFGTVAPSRSTATGGTRVARTAGMMLAATVTTTPTSRLTSTVRSAKTSPARGRSIWTILRAASSSLARPMPTPAPTAVAARPITNASSTIERSTCRREAPMVRRSASSRARWATVIEKVLKMMNAPTKSAIPAKPSRKILMKVTKPRSPLKSNGSASFAVRTVVGVPANAAATDARAPAGVTLVFAANAIVSTSPCLWNSRCAVRRSKAAIVAAPSESTFPHLARPTIVYRRSAPVATTPTESPIRRCSRLAVPASIVTSRGPAAQRPEPSVSGFTRSAPLASPSMPTPKFGGWPITFSFPSTSFAWSRTIPTAVPTAGTRRTFAM
jgi:hypothetical protein